MWKILKNLETLWNEVPAPSQQTFVLVKTYWRRLRCNIFLSSKTSWRRLEDIIAIRLANTSWRPLGRRLEDILGRRIANTSVDVLKTSSRCLGRQENVALKTSWKTRNVCWDSTSKRNKVEQLKVWLKWIQTIYVGQLDFLN